jgi:hypothetical protein
MANVKLRRNAALEEDTAKLDLAWGPLIRDGLREADATLQADTAIDADAQEAWSVVSRAFASSAGALRDLSR